VPLALVVIVVGSLIVVIDGPLPAVVMGGPFVVIVPEFFSKEFVFVSLP
jgi:hypothetical protein